MHSLDSQFTKHLFIYIVAVTACATGKIYSSSETILFPNVRKKIGITDIMILSMKTTGIFKCKKPGLYFVSSFIMANTNGNYYLAKNGGSIANGYFSLNGGYQTSTIVQLVLLNANDILYIKNGNSKNIHGGDYSCLSILQLIG